MRVDARRALARQPVEGGGVAPALAGTGAAVLNRYYLVHRHPFSLAKGPLAEIDVQTDAQSRPRPGSVGSVSSGRPANHQAGAGHNAAVVGREDTAGHAGALAEVV